VTEDPDEAEIDDEDKYGKQKMDEDEKDETYELGSEVDEEEEYNESDVVEGIGELSESEAAILALHNLIKWFLLVTTDNRCRWKVEQQRLGMPYLSLRKYTIRQRHDSSMTQTCFESISATSMMTR